MSTDSREGDASATTCGQLFAQPQAFAIVPSAAIEMQLPTAANKDMCKLRLYVRRDNILEIFKNIGPLVVIGYVPVLTLWLNPMIPPLVGGRVSAHILTMVLVMVKVSRERGEGKGERRASRARLSPERIGCIESSLTPLSAAPRALCVRLYDGLAQC